MSIAPSISNNSTLENKNHKIDLSSLKISPRREKLFHEKRSSLKHAKVESRISPLMAGKLKYPKGELNVLAALDRKLKSINEEGLEIIEADKGDKDEVVDKDTFEPPKDLQPHYTKVP